MGDNEDPNYSIVEYMSDHSGYQCGYCKSKDTNFSHGMWAYNMTVQNYQQLIDRGWRRSGKYCYKPTLDKTCCPQYTIKCDALDFKPSKSQKKVIKRMHAFLSHGTIGSNTQNIRDFSQNEPFEVEHAAPKNFVAMKMPNVQIPPSLPINQGKDFSVASEDLSVKSRPDEPAASIEKLPDSQSIKTTSEKTIKQVNKGVGQDPSKPPCKKAKLLRKERRAAKLSARGCSTTGDAASSFSSKVSGSNDPKSLEDLLSQPLPESPAHKLELRLLRVSFSEPQFADTFKSSYRVFRKYQMGIHNDPPDECEESSFRNFLVDGPLVPWKPSSGPPQGYGAFHMQYWLDGEIIAVGVVDILPNCLSSVYLYYDPKFSFLSLGTYATLREIAFTRKLQLSAPSLKWYYMGFYIHSCPKMRYKGNCKPSFLLCPEMYTWIPIEKCIPKLEVSKYSRLDDETISREESAGVDEVLCLFKSRPFQYGFVRQASQRSKKDVENVTEYLKLAGSDVAKSMLLYRS